jgi:phosphate transport system substrate-binding protein
VQPFAEEVANRVAKSAKVKRPLFEPTGTNAGFTQFCESGGLDSPNIVNASRPISKKEFDTCQSNGAGDLIEVKIGYDAIVIASAKKAKPLDLSRKDLYLALAKQVPEPTCKAGCEKIIPNSYATWQQINPALGGGSIEVLGPTFSSGSMEVFADTIMDAGCDSFVLAAKKTKPETDYKRLCRNLREDGVYTEETGETIASRLATSTDVVGILNYSRVKANAARLQAAKLDGIAPDYNSIAQQTYPAAFPLFFYVKKSHIGQVPGLQAYVNEFISDKAAGAKGYLLAKGLIALPAAEQKTVAANVKAQKPMALDDNPR